jgi:RNA polymerase sigma-70 factor (ECF subfamily)
MALMQSHTDEELVLLLNEDNEQAFRELYDRHWPNLYRAAYNVLRDQDACMDILQELFTWVWEHRSDLTIASPGSYLRSAVKYKVANYIRSRKVRSSLFTEVEAIDTDSLVADEDSYEVKELKEVIARFTESLPERAREVFRLSRQEHLSNKEIAQRLGISEKTVENQMTTNLKKLRTSIGRMNSWLLLFI